MESETVRWKIYGGHHQPQSPSGKTYTKIGSTHRETVGREMHLVERIVRKITTPISLTEEDPGISGESFNIHLNVDWFVSGDLLADKTDVVQVVSEPVQKGSFFEYEVIPVENNVESPLKRVVRKTLISLREKYYREYIEFVSNKPDGWTWQEWYRYLTYASKTLYDE